MRMRTKKNNGDAFSVPEQTAIVDALSYYTMGRAVHEDNFTSDQEIHLREFAEELLEKLLKKWRPNW